MIRGFCEICFVFMVFLKSIEFVLLRKSMPFIIL